VWATPGFRLQNSPTVLDGGNLFKLDDGRLLLTTRALLSQKDQEKLKGREDRERRRLKQVTYLDPPDRPVYEHYDLFAPAGRRKNESLLASYDLTVLAAGVLEQIARRRNEFSQPRRTRDGTQMPKE